MKERVKQDFYMPVRMPSGVVRRLDCIARERGVTRSRVVVNALSEFVASQQAEKGESVRQVSEASAHAL